jgi:hypothetical protein
MFVKAVYFTTFAVWLASFATIASLGGEFDAQAPMCIGATIVIFSISTLIIKQYEKKQNER